MINKTRLSESQLWQKQRAFYMNQGVQAWNNKVPFYATCNTNVANAYANIILSFISDRKGQYEDDIDHRPFYIVELAAGTGACSFYLVKRLQELKSKFKLTSKDFVYVISDMVESNIEFWEQNDLFKEYIRDGILDVARVDLEHNVDIQLKYQQVSLSKANQKPIIFIANYLIDTLPHDVFKVENGQLLEGIVNYQTDMAPLPLNMGISLSDLNSELTYQQLTMPYYQDEAMNMTLRGYEHNHANHYFTMPVGGLRAINTLQQISHNNFLLLTTDKGYSRHTSWHEQMPPDVVFHGECFSMSVNFHAMGRYMEWIGGDYYHQETEQGITTSAFLVGHRFKLLPVTYGALKENLDVMSPGNLFNLYRMVETNRFAWSLEGLVAYLTMSQWDPYVFNACLDALLQKVKLQAVSKPLLDDLYNGIRKIESNIYDTPGQGDVLANIGLFFQEMCHYEQALHYYQKSLAAGKEIDTTYYNMGLCYVSLEQAQPALKKFQSAVRINPGYVNARGWISTLERKQIHG